MKNLAELLMHVPFKEQMRRIKIGLQAPKTSAEYKYAREALLCMFGPSTASMVGSIMVACCALFIQIEGHSAPVDTSYAVEMVDPSTTKLDELKVEEDKKVEEFTPPEQQDPNLDPSLAVGEKSEITTPGPPQEFSSNDDPAGVGNGVGGDMDTPVVPFAVVMTKSPMIMKGLYGNRTKGGREKALKAYGGGGGSGMTEVAVMRALRWLKKNQQSDGSWEKTKPAMTGMALLAYLAHGETPASEEFGPTVEKAIKWMIDNQEESGHFKGRDGHDYSHPIAAYALCEAYGMIKLPMLKYAAEKAIDVIIKGQHSSGGWDYNCKQSDRDDTSYMGWCAQAMKAAKMAELETAGIADCMRKAVDGFKKNSAKTGYGGFGYTGPGDGGLTGIGVLCMQLMGAAKDADCMNGLDWLEKNCTFDWEKPWLANPIYYWYYATQAKFHAGGPIWATWNKIFAPQLVKNQKVLKEGIDGTKGKKFDIGWWEPPSNIKGHTDGIVQDTCLCTLQLEVYYRYLPSFKSLEVEGEGKDGKDGKDKKDKKAVSDDIEVKVTKGK